MHWVLYREEDGTLFDEYALSKQRYEVLLGRKKRGILTPNQEEELERNKYGRMIKQLYDDSLYHWLSIRHQERNKGKPKD